MSPLPPSSTNLPPSSSSVPVTDPNGPRVAQLPQGLQKLQRILGTERRSRIRTTEGPRGAATRASIWVRHLVYFGTVLGCCSVTHAALSAAATTQSGGLFMLFAATLMAFVGALGCALYPTHRDNIVEELRHYMFGVCLYPATGVAVVIWAMQSMLNSPTAGTDTMGQLLAFSVPVIFVCTLIIPPVIFIKVVAGAQTLHRSTLDDEELVALHTRQGPLQR